MGAKLLKCAFISTQMFEADVSQLFFGSIPYLSFLPRLTVSEMKVAGQTLASSWLFWPATGPY